MENHPIPQDVTGFQFKLIGNMTIKQFAYVATGAILAVIFYYAPFPLIIKIFFIPLFGGVGAALAFLPIEGRPADMMLSSFLHELFVPTQYLYHKQGGALAISTIQIQPFQPKQTQEKHKEVTGERTKQLAQLLNSAIKTSKNTLDAKEEMFIQSLSSLSTASLPQILSSVNQSQSQPEMHQLSNDEITRAKIAQSPEDMEHELEKEAEAIKEELSKAQNQEQELSVEHQPTEVVHDKVTKLEQELNDIMEQKQQLEQELLRMKAQAQQPITPQVEQPQAPAQPSENVRSVPTDKAATVGLITLPRDPNLVSGIIKDSRGNVLPNVLVEIKDTEETPVRAFKTNGLGQFASATPLANGSYTIEFEDPRGVSKFEVVAIEATGDILLPLEIISTDAREELRKELFN